MWGLQQLLKAEVQKHSAFPQTPAGDRPWAAWLRSSIAASFLHVNSIIAALKGILKRENKSL